MSAAARVNPRTYFSRREWARLSHHSSWRGLALVAHCWLMIGAAGAMAVVWPITLPLAVPGLISAGIFSFTLSWNEFIYALAFIQSSANTTVPVAILTELVSGDVYQWGALMAGSLLGSLPVAVFYSLFVDYYVSSLTGAVKE